MTQQDSKPRLELYGPIHKALRLGHAQVLTALGATDWEDDAAMGAMLDKLVSHLGLCVSHLKHEDTFIHPMIADANPDAEAELEREHEHHSARLQALYASCDRLEENASAARPQLGRQLYLDFTAFMAADFAHMEHEETVIMPLLWKHYDDEALQAVHTRLVSSIDPTSMIQVMQLMLPAIGWRERHGLLADMRRNAPEAAFNAILIHAAKPSLAPADWQRLVDDLGIAA